jgi:hypothetical protein
MSVIITTGPRGGLSPRATIKRHEANTAIMTVCSPLSNPQRIWSFARKASGIAIR